MNLKQTQEHSRIIGHVLRYELYRHRDISERLSNLLQIDTDPDAFNRSTWDILFFLMQSHLQKATPSVTDIYLATKLSKGTAITGLAELERRGAIQKVRDNEDGRRRRIDISDKVAEVLNDFVAECEERLGQSYELPLEAPPVEAPMSKEDADPLIGLLGQLSHELRTPLTAIVGFSEMIANETLGPVHPVGYAEYARDIRHAASNLLDSLNDLVDTTLAEHGENIPLGPLTQVNLEEVVDNACRASAAIAERRGVVLRRKWGAAKGLILGDYDRISQAVRKLIEATIASTDRGQTIDVETTFDAKNGVMLQLIAPEPLKLGLTPEPKKAIGAPNYDTFAKGMPLIRSIAEAHRGAITSRQDGPRRYITTMQLPKDVTPARY